MRQIPEGKRGTGHDQMAENIELIPYQSMLEAGMHFGRKRSVFNPAMGTSVYAVRDGICIIDLVKTQEMLAKTIEFLNSVLQSGGMVLWVAPTKQSQEGIKKLAEQTNMPYVLDRWLGGTLTNFKNLNGRVKRLVQLEEEQSSGGWEKYTKKEQLDLSREVDEMKKKFDGLKKLTRIPDAIFVASLKEGELSVHEGKLTGVKIAAISNTDANPAGIERVICANDRSKRSVDLVLNAIAENLQAGLPPQPTA